MAIQQEIQDYVSNSRISELTEKALRNTVHLFGQGSQRDELDSFTIQRVSKNDYRLTVKGWSSDGNTPGSAVVCFESGTSLGEVIALLETLSTDGTFGWIPDRWPKPQRHGSRIGLTQNQPGYYDASL